MLRRRVECLMGIEKEKGGLISHKAKGRSRRESSWSSSHGDVAWVKFMGHGKHRDAYRLEAPPNCELSGAGLSLVVKVGRLRWTNGSTSARTTRRRPSSA